MSTSTNEDAYKKKMDEAYTQSMANFSACHATTTFTTDGLKLTNAQQAHTIVLKHQQQLMMMMQQQIVANVYDVPPNVYGAPT